MIRLQVSAVEEDKRMADCDGDTLVLFGYDPGDAGVLSLNAEVNSSFAEERGSAVGMVVAMNALSTCVSAYMKSLGRSGVMSAGPDDCLMKYSGGSDAKG